MKKAEKAKITSMFTHTSTDKLHSDLLTFTNWTSNHERKIKSWFWASPCTARERRRQEAMYTFHESVKIGDVMITYNSDCSMSCKYIYWDDGLTSTIPDASVTFGDIAYIIATIKEIIAKRNASKAS